MESFITEDDPWFPVAQLFSPLFLMDRIDDKPSGLRNHSLEGVEIKLWEIYLLRNRTNIGQVLTSYSLNNGPVPHDIAGAGRVSFRFTAYDWTKSVMQLLQTNHIPFEITGKFRIDDPKDNRKKKVYIAEDDLNILFALNTILEDAGYDVLLSHCGERMLENNLPATDLFILDKLMPGVDGIQVCKHLRKHAHTKNTPVIMISASRNSASEAYAAGVNDFLEKPFQMKKLLELVAKHTSTDTPRIAPMQPR